MATITTIKLAAATKDRLDHFRLYRRETYDDVVQRLLELLNLCRLNPESARLRLLALDKQRKSTARQPHGEKL